MRTVFNRGDEEIPDDAAINEVVGWDSLNHVSLMIELEGRGCTIDLDLIGELTSYVKIKDYLEQAGVSVA